MIEILISNTPWSGITVNDSKALHGPKRNLSNADMLWAFLLINLYGPKPMSQARQLVWLRAFAAHNFGPYNRFTQALYLVQKTALDRYMEMISTATVRFINVRRKRMQFNAYLRTPDIYREACTAFSIPYSRGVLEGRAVDMLVVDALVHNHPWLESVLRDSVTQREDESSETHAVDTVAIKDSGVRVLAYNPSSNTTTTILADNTVNNGIALATGNTAGNTALTGPAEVSVTDVPTDPNSTTLDELRAVPDPEYKDFSKAVEPTPPSTLMGKLNKTFGKLFRK